MNWMRIRWKLLNWLWPVACFCAVGGGLFYLAGVAAKLDRQDQKSALPSITQPEAGHFFVVEDKFRIGGSMGQLAWVIRDKRTGKQYRLR